MHIKRFEKAFTVGFDEIDASGWLYGAVYFKYVNELFFAMLEDVGFPHPEMLKNGFSLPPVKYEIEFFKPARYGDVVVGELRVVRLGNSSIHLEFSFRDKEGRVVYAKGSTVRVFVDQRREKSMPLPDDLRKKLLG